MRPQTVPILACPRCEQGLRHTAADGETEVLFGELACSGCGAVFPIVHGVPRFLRRRTLTQQAFHRQWDGWARGALRDDANNDFYGIDLAKRVARHIDHLKITADDTVLEVGAGHGEVIAGIGKAVPGARCIAVDSACLEHARQRRGGVGTIDYVVGDALQLPIADGAVSVAIADGILHHTPDPYGAFMQVAKAVKPGGRFAVWIYPTVECLSETFPAWAEQMAKYYWIRDRLFFGRAHRLPAGVLRVMVKGLAHLIRAGAHDEMAAGNDMGVGGRLTVKEMEFIQLDNLAPEFQFRFHRDTVRSWFAEAGFVDVQRDFPGHFWGTKATRAFAAASPRSHHPRADS